MPVQTLLFNFRIIRATFSGVQIFKDFYSISFSEKQLCWVLAYKNLTWV